MRAWAWCSSAALFLLLAHLPYLSRPYFWDEAGQFIPASLDFFYSGDIVPYSTLPNVHPPGMMLWLAAAWRLFGYSIVTTRAAMLVIAMLACWWVYRLASEFLCLDHGRHDHRAAVMTLVLVCLSPLFFSASIMALLDMPAMALTVLALLLFLRERMIPAATACAVLVMVKETGALLPAVFAMVLARERRWKQCVWFVLPGLPLAAWLLLLHARTSNWLGNAMFAHYNLQYPRSPARLGMALFRRGYYLFASTGYFIGTAVLLKKLRVAQWRRAWRVAGIFAVAHVLAMCVVGGAVLERYLLPVLPITLAAFANALCSLTPRWRNGAFVAMCAASATCIFLNPIYPFPFENNLAWVDFVDVQHDAAVYLSNHLAAGATIASSFPFASCMRRPELGYTSQRFAIDEIPDFTRTSIEKLRGKKLNALAVFSKTQDSFGIMRNPRWIAFLEKYDAYQPAATTNEIEALLGMHVVARFEVHGQSIEVLEP